MNDTCSVDGCDRGGQMRRGMCSLHYGRLWYNKQLDNISAVKRCEVEGCDRKHYGNGKCDLHLRRWRKYGTTDLPHTLTVEERFASRLAVMPSGCIEWTGLTKHGYGLISRHHKHVLTHRFAWELVNGPIPDGLLVCHKCDNPPCCNVEHLFLGTNADNLRDMSSKGRNHEQKKTHCPKGHEYAGDNLHVGPRGNRVCITCRRAATAQYKRKKKASASD